MDLKLGNIASPVNSSSGVANGTPYLSAEGAQESPEGMDLFESIFSNLLLSDEEPEQKEAELTEELPQDEIQLIQAAVISPEVISTQNIDESALDDIKIGYLDFQNPGSETQEDYEAVEAAEDNSISSTNFQPEMPSVVEFSDELGSTIITAPQDWSSSEIDIAPELANSFTAHEQVQLQEQIQSQPQAQVQIASPQPTQITLQAAQPSNEQITDITAKPAVANSNIISGSILPTKANEGKLSITPENEKNSSTDNDLAFDTLKNPIAQEKPQQNSFKIEMQVAENDNEGKNTVESSLPLETSHEEKSLEAPSNNPLKGEFMKTESALSNNLKAAVLSNNEIQKAWNDNKETIELQVQSLKTSDKKSVKFTLNPKDLGSIEIRFDTDQKNGMTKIVFSAEKYSTFDMLNKSSAEIEKMFSSNGFSAQNSSLSFQMQNENTQQEFQNNFADKVRNHKESNEKPEYFSGKVTLLESQSGVNLII